LLTGRRPTITGYCSDYRTPAGGQFFEFTKSVLAALNIKASADAPLKLYTVYSPPHHRPDLKPQKVRPSTG